MHAKGYFFILYSFVGSYSGCMVIEIDAREVLGLFLVSDLGLLGG